jgi:hypothetical protein
LQPIGAGMALRDQGASRKSCPFVSATAVVHRMLVPDSGAMDYTPEHSYRNSFAVLDIILALCLCALVRYTA